MRGHIFSLVASIMLLLVSVVGCGDDDPIQPDEDTRPPATVADLTCPTVTSSSVTLTWTAPGDDGASGTASRYDIRYSTSNITDANFASADEAANIPKPNSAGTTEVFTIAGLQEKTTYYFALKTADDATNWSGLSVVANATTSAEGVAPAAVTNLASSSPTANSVTLTWTAPGDDGMVGTATEYDIRYSTSVITDANFDAADQAPSPPVPSLAGSGETFTVTGLAEQTTYYFALKAADEVPNWSGLSNVVTGTTSSEAVPPALISNLVVDSKTAYSATLTWTAPGDDGNSGTASEYDIRYSTAVITPANFESATRASNIPAPNAAGSAESFTVTGLLGGWTYNFAIKTADEVPNWSGMSNVATTTTEQPLVQITTNSALDRFPDWSPDGAQLAFASQRSGNTDVWTIPAVGGTAVQVTTGSGTDNSPAWSPDGTTIAYYSDRGLIGSTVIMTIPATGGSTSQITTNPGQGDFGPCWSPDGSQIAFNSLRSGNHDIWTIPSSGGTPTQVTTNSAWDANPAWSPDGNLLAFYSQRSGGSDIWTIPAGGGTAVRLTTTGTAYPDWSPDGSLIAYEQGGNIWTMPAAGGAAVQITDDADLDGQPAWSPDGNRLAFDRRHNGNYDIWIVWVK
jgi:Tol biopolymer transport system component